MELVLAAAKAAIPNAVLAMLAEQKITGRAPPSTGKAGASQASKLRGRPAGVRRGESRNGNVLSLIETQRAAAPLQLIASACAADRHASKTAANASKSALKISASAASSRRRPRHVSSSMRPARAPCTASPKPRAPSKSSCRNVTSAATASRSSPSRHQRRHAAAADPLPDARQRSLAGLSGGGGTTLATRLNALRSSPAQQKQKGISPTIVMLHGWQSQYRPQRQAGRKAAMADAMAVAENLRALAIKRSPDRHLATPQR